MRPIASSLILSALMVMVCARYANGVEPRAPLKWQNVKHVAHATPADEHSMASYSFKNVSNSSVRIVTVRTTCGCIIAKTDKDIYAPGESGALTATFVFGTRTGRHVNQIWVIANDGQTHEMALELDVTIPPLLRIEPVTVVWKNDVPAQPKAIRVLNAQEKPVRITDIICDPEYADAKLETVTHGKEYQIILTPKAHDRRVETILLIRTDFPAGNPRIFSVRLIMEAPVI